MSATTIPANGSSPHVKHSQSLPPSSASTGTGQSLATTPSMLAQQEDNESLRRRIIALLAGTANGCISELRYPELCARLEQLEKSQPRLEEELSKAKARISILEREKEDLLVELGNSRGGSGRSTSSLATRINENEVRGLKERLERAQWRIKELERMEGLLKQVEAEKKLVMEHNTVLLQSLKMSNDQRYNVLEEKYNYLLGMVSRHNIIIEPAPDAEGKSIVVKSRTPQTSSNRSPLEKNPASNVQQQEPKQPASNGDERVKSNETPIASSSKLESVGVTSTGNAPPTTDADEGPDEDWSDLTDDEGGEKQSVLECVSAVYYDDDHDNRHCKLCKIRVDNGLMPESPNFSESSMRELIYHLKKTHPKAWINLRKGAEEQKG